MKDQYGSTVDFKIEVDMVRCEEKDDESNYMCEGYHWCILGFYIPNDDTKTPYWYNTGVCGIETSPELAFEESIRRYKEHISNGK